MFLHFAYQIFLIPTLFFWKQLLLAIVSLFLLILSVLVILLIPISYLCFPFLVTELSLSIASLEISKDYNIWIGHSSNVLFPNLILAPTKTFTKTVFVVKPILYSSLFFSSLLIWTISPTFTGGLYHWHNCVSHEVQVDIPAAIISMVCLCRLECA